MKKAFSGGGKPVNFSFTGPLDKLEKMLLRLMGALAMFIIFYIAFSNVTTKQIDSKTQEINDKLTTARSEIAKIDSDTSTINSRASMYRSAINSVNDLSDNTAAATESRIIPKDAIPNLLNRIMFIIPRKVIITSIKNTTDNHIVIEAQAEKYEQLGYFKALIDSKGILVDVKSTSGVKDGSVVKVTIEGELP